MARSYANFTTAIWRDDDFRALSMAGQHTFMMLNTQADISAAGVLTMALTRWASRTSDLTPSRIREGISELERAGFVVVDEGTEEILVRSFVRWDKGYSNANRQPSIRDAADAIESPALRWALAKEFERLAVPDRCVPESYAQVECPSDGPINSPSEGPSDGHRHAPSDGDRDGDRVVVTEDLVVDSTTRIPKSASRIPADASGGGGAREDARGRGTRIPDDFAVDADLVAWARENTPHVDGRYETEKFIDYFRAKSGKDATKRDWPATWKNWMRKAQEDIRRPRGPSTGANRHTAQRHDNPFAEQS